jgi:hypothetical protein
MSQPHITFPADEIHSAATSGGGVYSVRDRTRSLGTGSILSKEKDSVAEDASVDERDEVDERDIKKRQVCPNILWKRSLRINSQTRHSKAGLCCGEYHCPPSLNLDAHLTLLGLRTNQLVSSMATLERAPSTSIPPPSPASQAMWTCLALCRSSFGSSPLWLPSNTF